jgi:hypothetical protein
VLKKLPQLSGEQSTTTPVTSAGSESSDTNGGEYEVRVVWYGFTDVSDAFDASIARAIQQAHSQLQAI